MDAPVTCCGGPNRVIIAWTQYTPRSIRTPPAMVGVKGVDHVPGKHLIVTGRSFLVSQRDTPNAADFRQNLADGIHAGVLLVADPFEENHPGLTGLIDQLHS